MTAVFQTGDVRTGEAPFGLDETFFSRTDGRGVIRAYNDVFMRISGFPAAELRNAPHRLIRHPDMPKGVFQLLWDGIQSGYPVAAYVKNKAKDGRYYWVLALVTPCNGGYLSVRMKPTSGLFAQVVAEYAALLAAERDEKLTPPQSAARLLGRLTELGFARYANFQARALASEFVAHDAALRAEPDGRIAAMLRLAEQAETIRAQKARVTADLRRLQLVPVNMRIISARIERSGGPLGAIADNYRDLAGTVMRELNRLLGDGDAASPFVMAGEEAALFQHGASRLMRMAERQFARQTMAGDGIDIAAERSALAALAADYDAQASEALVGLARISGRLVADIGSLRRAIVALDSIRIMSRVECGRMPKPHEGLASLITALDGFHSGLDAHLYKIAGAAQSVREEADLIGT
ncbi:PAS domain-containing protein [Paragemmobacter straminiformis]|uniref:PAS domain-containing protein n=1 Tax=Paragemmobacter straminiformis TaxID=2045119 RepID=A0A842I5I4_9RHOB|nr:PAS domain-containing protein [Gemmobacter straminiformis]MBC2834896.1 PAS domain-containing protein [Gemmobacter straminiformis]